jgi:putative ABC transport system permease protein
MAQFPSMPAFLVLRAPNAGRLAEPVRAAIGVIDKDILVTDASTMQEAISQSVAQPRFRTGLLGAFAGVALLLAAIGIYGVVAYSVSQRMHEFGIRIALGAQAGNVIGMVLGASGWLMLVGIATGLAGSFALTRLLKALLFEVSPTDPLTFVIVAGGLAGIALLATLVPARRATRIDPVSALRDE